MLDGSAHPATILTQAMEGENLSWWLTRKQHEDCKWSCNWWNWRLCCDWWKLQCHTLYITKPFSNFRVSQEPSCCAAPRYCNIRPNKMLLPNEIFLPTWLWIECAELITGRGDGEAAAMVVIIAVAAEKKQEEGGWRASERETGGRHCRE
jgi:hypothetical protein